MPAKHLKNVWQAKMGKNLSKRTKFENKKCLPNI